MNKIYIVVGIIVFLVVIIYLIGKMPNNSEPRPSPSQTAPRESVQKQLEDVNKKIAELPELENDIFSKCVETTEGTADDIKACQESTQKQIFTLSQDLNNLKKSLEEKK